jgi:hypothetical protein
MPEEFHFTASVWLWQGEAAWTFVTVPKRTADAIKQCLPEKRRQAFGTVRVTAQVNHTRWQTSLFPDKKSGAYVLPLKAAIRKREQIHEGMPLEVLLTVL